MCTHIIAYKSIVFGKSNITNSSTWWFGWNRRVGDWFHIILFLYSLGPGHLPHYLEVVQHCYNIVQTVAIMWVYQKCSTVIMCKPSSQRDGFTQTVVLGRSRSWGHPTWGFYVPHYPSNPGQVAEDRQAHQGQVHVQLACRVHLEAHADQRSAGRTPKKRIYFKKRSASLLGQRNWWSRTLPTIPILDFNLLVITKSVSNRVAHHMARPINLPNPIIPGQVIGQLQSAFMAAVEEFNTYGAAVFSGKHRIDSAAALQLYGFKVPWVEWIGHQGSKNDTISQ